MKTKEFIEIANSLELDNFEIDQMVTKPRDDDKGELHGGYLKCSNDKITINAQVWCWGEGIEDDIVISFSQKDYEPGTIYIISLLERYVKERKCKLEDVDALIAFYRVAARKVRILEKMINNK